MSSAANSAPIDVRGPAAPAHLRTDEPDGDAQQRAHRQRQSVSAPSPLTQAGSSMAQARIRPRTATSASDRASPPRGGGRRTGASLIAAARPRPGPRAAGPGPTTSAISYSARAWRSARDRWRCASARVASSAGGSNGALRRAATTTAPIPRLRSAASGRMNDGSCDAVMTIAVMPRRSRPTPVTSASSSGVLPVGLDGGEQLEDLEPLARAAVGRQDGAAGARSP